MESRRLPEDISTLHDTQETSKRSIQLLKLAIIVACFIIPVRLFFGHYYAAIINICFIVFCFVLTRLLKKNKSGSLKMITIIGVDAFLAFYSIADGLRAGDYLYLFPMFFALPLLINKHERYNREVASYF